jgi:dienelactone hydrolase
MAKHVSRKRLSLPFPKGGECMHPFVSCILIALAVGCPTTVGAEALSFDSVVSPSDRTATLNGSLSFPAGAGPFPVVILLHPCGGLDSFGLTTLEAHARNLQTAGFGAFILDSYGPRNLGGGKACGMETSRFRSDDAFNAIAFLAKHPKVSKDNIFVLGLSSGGSAAIEIARGKADTKFSAAVAYYPECISLGGTSYAIQSPMLVFVAGKDDWTLPDSCLRAKSAGTVIGAEFDLINYPNAYHGFDQHRDHPATYRGHTLAYSAEATIDSRRRVIEFFARHLTEEFQAKAHKVRN